MTRRTEKAVDGPEVVVEEGHPDLDGDDPGQGPGDDEEGAVEVAELQGPVVEHKPEDEPHEAVQDHRGQGEDEVPEEDGKEGLVGLGEDEGEVLEPHEVEGVDPGHVRGREGQSPVQEEGGPFHGLDPGPGPLPLGVGLHDLPHARVTAEGLLGLGLEDEPRPLMGHHPGLGGAVGEAVPFPRVVGEGQVDREADGVQGEDEEES